MAGGGGQGGVLGGEQGESGPKTAAQGGRVEGSWGKVWAWGGRVKPGSAGGAVVQWGQGSSCRTAAVTQWPGDPLVGK